MGRIFALSLMLLGSFLAGCASSGQSVGGSVSAPATVKRPDFLNPEISAYAPRIYSVLSEYGFKVGNTNNPDALRLEINFDPNVMGTTVSIKLFKPGAGVIASAEAVNHGWGTLIARDQAIGNLVESAANQFSQQLSMIHFTLASDKNN